MKETEWRFWFADYSMTAYGSYTKARCEIYLKRVDMGKNFDVDLVEVNRSGRWEKIITPETVTI